VDEVLDLAARQFRSQSNGRNTNTSDTEAPQAAFADSNSNDRPSIHVNSLLQEATAAEVEVFFEPATPAQVATTGLDRLTLDSRPPNSKGTDAPQAATAEDSKEPQSIANPTQGNTSRAYIDGPDVMVRCDMVPEQSTKSSEKTTPASDLLGPGYFKTKDL
jgi:hypothetical protein